MNACKICGTALEHLSRELLRGSYEIVYYSCPQCEFIQTEEPYWLSEAYASPINLSDVGYVARNHLFSNLCSSLIRGLFPKAGKFVDYGAGYGLFVRMMRDRGFDWKWQDRFCPNLFVRGFEAQVNDRFDILTAFEVFEHLVDPVAEVKQMLELAPTIFFSTSLLPKPRVMPADWDYYGLEHGQHISLFSLRSLEALARRFELHLCSDGNMFHVLSKERLSPFKFRIFTNRFVYRALNVVGKKSSLIESDYQQMKLKAASENQAS